MIRAKLTTGETIGISFEHIRLDPPASSRTTCEICRQRSPKKQRPWSDPFAEGWASCHHKDNFSKEFGRKLSLARALQAARFGKQDRKLIWEAYHSRRAAQAAGGA